MRMLRALESRNYRLFFVGQGVSLVGGFMTRVASSWLVYRLTGSPLLLGVVGFAASIPTFFLAPLAGALVDRWDRRRTIQIALALSMLESLALALLAVTGIIAVWHVVALNLFQGIVDAFETPARQSFFVQMVERREDLPNAIALNSSLFQSARLVGPSIGGAVVAVAGEAACFFLDALSYLAAIAAYRMMRLGPRAAPPRAGSLAAELREGLGYVLGSPPIRAILGLLALSSLVGMPFVTLLPVMTRDVLGGGPGTYGLLMGAVGVGALVGTLHLAARTSIRGLGTVIAVAAAVFGAALVAFAFSRTVGLSAGLLALCGAGMMTQAASSNTVIQSLVDDPRRGRVMAIYAWAIVGMMPFGSLAAGALASRIGAPATLALGGSVLILGGVLFGRSVRLVREALRPIWQPAD